MPDISFATLKKTARSYEDVAQWFLDHLHLLPDVPASLHPHIEVTVSPMQQFFNPSKVTKLVSYTKVVFSHKAEPVLPDVFKNEAGLRVLTYTASTLFHKELHCEFDALEWPFLMAQTLWEYHIRALGSWTDFQEQALRQHLPTTFPTFRWETYENLAASELLPDTQDAFLTWVLQHRADNTVDIQLPQGGLA